MAAEAGSLVIATGGLSIPKMGATNFGYRLARQFGLQVLLSHTIFASYCSWLQFVVNTPE